MSNQLNYKEFWMQVIHEYTECNPAGSVFLCNASPTFDAEFRVHKDEMKALAQQFLDETDWSQQGIQVPEVISSWSSLFEGAMFHESLWVIRMDFLNWNLNRLSVD